mmetsp:Transcript_68128/g.76271  ORF Transcript_68128/g.76271 Transcript_68128/m.76271 type:complete len:85 (+) Transcript_68128:798-1052(+)
MESWHQLFMGRGRTHYPFQQECGCRWCLRAFLGLVSGNDNSHSFSSSSSSSLLQLNTLARSNNHNCHCFDDHSQYSNNNTSMMR